MYIVKVDYYCQLPFQVSVAKLTLLTLAYE